MSFSLFDDFSSGFSNIKNFNINSTDIFSMSNTQDYTIQSNLSTGTVRDIQSQLNSFSQPINLNNLNTTMSGVTTLLSNNLTLTLNYNKGNVNNYAYFGSLAEYIRVEIQNVIQAFPGSLFADSVSTAPLFTIINYSYNPNQDIATFQVPASVIVNNYNLNYTFNPNPLAISTGITNVTANYTSYVVWNLIDEFSVINFTGSTSATTGYVYIQTEGNPFPAASGGTLLTNFHIKPNFSYFENYINGLDDFSAYLLNRDNSPQYTAIFKEPIETENGNDIFVDRVYTWPVTDGYNLDTNTNAFDTYYNDLIDLGDTYDNYKSDLISRFLTTTALKEFDTPDAKINKLLRIYGREFDEIKLYIDGLANIAKTSYDKKDNIPDVLVKNFAKTLGWGVVSTYSEDDLMKSFLGENQDTIFSGQTKNLTPVETDIELWRRLIINSGHLFKSKGTRNCIDFLFRIIGAPESLVSFNEYVYLVDKKIDVSSVVNNSSLNYPFDSQGFPVISASTNDLYFQMAGGWISNVEIAPNNDKTLSSAIGIHSGNYDDGQSYFNNFRNFDNQQGFALQRTIDNVKSWTYVTGQTTERINLDKNTDYTIQDSRLVLNSKEASIYLDPAQAIEYDVYQYNQAYDYVINSTSLPYPYPNNVLTQNEISNLSFLQYVDLIYSNFIDVRNRKVADDTHGSGYPTLRKLYEDYYNVSSVENLPPSNQLTFAKVKKYIDSIDSFWISLIEQFIPSTTIWEGGVLYRNTVFDRQKFVYKHGINDGSEFATKVNGATESNDITISSINGKVNLPYTGNISNIIEGITSFSTTLNFTNNTNNNINKLIYKSKINTNILKISEPCFIINQAAKIATGNTEPVIHNISNSNKELDFVFNCNTNLFDPTSNPNTKFRFTIYPYDYTNDVFIPQSVYQYVTSNDLSGQTGATRGFNQILPVNFTDGDYLVKGSFIFTGLTNNVIPVGYQFLQSAYTIDTSTFNTTAYYEFGLYDSTLDYWFGIISNPNKPILLQDLYDTSTTGNTILALTGLTLVNDNIPLTSSIQNVFLYNDKPVGDIIINVNGSSLIRSSAITFNDGGEFFVDITTYPTAILITLANSLTQVNNDILNIIYLKNSLGPDNSNIVSEYQTISFIPSGSSGIMGGKILYNTTINKYEYDFNFGINQNVDYNQIIVILNGNTLIKNTDYYQSTANNFGILFNGGISLGDVLLFYYPSVGLNPHLYLKSKNFTADWTAFNDDSPGIYTVQVASASDTTFSSILYTVTTPFIIDATLTNNTYSIFVATITTPNLSFIYRVKADKFFTNLLGETFTTTVYSDVLTFLTDNRVLG